MSKLKFKSSDQMTEKEFIEKYLPADHNDQDKIYLEKRYQWERHEIDYTEVSKAYEGTTFQKRL